ncbi:hypothetical protein R6Q59_021380 [Mikania micrantha]
MKMLSFVDMQDERVTTHQIAGKCNSMPLASASFTDLLRLQITRRASLRNSKCKGCLHEVAPSPEFSLTFVNWITADFCPAGKISGGVR